MATSSQLSLKLDTFVADRGMEFHSKISRVSMHTLVHNALEENWLKERLIWNMRCTIDSVNVGFYGIECHSVDVVSTRPTK